MVSLLNNLFILDIKFSCTMELQETHYFLCFCRYLIFSIFSSYIVCTPKSIYSFILCHINNDSEHESKLVLCMPMWYWFIQMTSVSNNFIMYVNGRKCFIAQTKGVSVHSVCAIRKIGGLCAARTWWIINGTRDFLRRFFLFLLNFTSRLKLVFW